MGKTRNTNACKSIEYEECSGAALSAPLLLLKLRQPFLYAEVLVNALLENTESVRPIPQSRSDLPAIQFI